MKKIMITLHQNCELMASLHDIQHIFGRFFCRLGCLCIILCPITNNAETVSGHLPKYETRAVWLTTIGGLDWPKSYSQSARSEAKQKEELCCILDKLKQAGINTVLLQTRIRATTIYPSAFEPWDGCLSGKPGSSPGYDALEYAINECHKRGMELHAWVVAIPVGKWTGAGCQRLRKTHPELLKRIGNEGFMNPAKQGTANYIAQLCSEITRNYDIDGIHLDYIRYPEQWIFGKAERQQEQKRRDWVTNIVSQTARQVKTLKPWVKMSCAPIGKYSDLPRCSSRGWNAYARGCQDAQLWTEKGWMDMLLPMMYFRDQQFYPFLFDWIQNSHGRTFAAGLGAYMLAEQDWQLEELTRQMEVCRQQGAGIAFFRSSFLTDDTKGLYQYTANLFNKAPALTPPMKWQEGTAPSAPTNIQVVRTDSADYVSWQAASDGSGAPNLLYNVYADTTEPVDCQRAELLVATRVGQTHVCVRRKTGSPTLFYHVTALNRYGIESSTMQTDDDTNPNKETADERKINANQQLLQSMERGIHEPHQKQCENQVLDTKHVVIESVAGNLITILPWNRGNIDIHQLPNGCFTIRSLHKKGVNHRLGSFIKKGNNIRLVGPTYSSFILYNGKNHSRH